MCATGKGSNSVTSLQDGGPAEGTATAGAPSARGSARVPGAAATGPAGAKTPAGKPGSTRPTTATKVAKPARTKGQKHRRKPAAGSPPGVTPETAVAAVAGTGKRRGPLWAKIVIGLGSLVILASVGAGVAVKVALNKVSNSIQTQDLLRYQHPATTTGGNGAPAPVIPAGTDIKGAINMLLIGLDTRIMNPAMGSRSDSIIIAHIPPSHDKVFLISIPRDTWVDIPGHGHNKINAAFQYGSSNGGGFAGGTQMLAKTIKSVWDIDFQGAAIIQFDGFKDIVKQLGGVRMYVDETTVSLHNGYRHGTTTPAAPFIVHTDGTRGSAIPGVDPVIYKKGWHNFTPKEALDFVRCRDGLVGTDYARQRHQQQFIKALLQQAYDKGMSDPTRLTSFLSSISKAFVFSPGTASVADWIWTLKGINPSAIVTIKTNGGWFYSAHVSGTSAEAMNPTSQQMMLDLKNDNLAQFVQQHQDWIA
jgi:LCP family protein required for cell wall assembly